MTKDKQVRQIAILHHKNGYKPKEISSLLANVVHISTLKRWIAHFKKTGQITSEQKILNAYIYMHFT
jgi:transposase